MFKTAAPLCLVLVALAGCDSDSAASTKMQDDSAATCTCPLDWEVDNMAVCVSVHTAFTPTLVYSSYLSDGQITCDTAKGFPQPLSAHPWSEQRISSPCAGSGRLWVRARHGRSKMASPDDCLLAEQMVEFDYADVNQVLTLPALPSWSAQDQQCARVYEEEGGYYELTIESDQLGCGVTDSKVMYVDICPLRCNTNPNGPGCDECDRDSTLTHQF